ncbi:hypothetical protein [Azospirillum sp. sgz301742]
MPITIPSMAAPPLTTAVAHYQAGRFAAADGAARQILLSRPNDAGALQLLALCEMRQDCPEMAAAILDAVLARNPGLAAARRLHADVRSLLPRPAASAGAERFAVCLFASEFREVAIALHHGFAAAGADVTIVFGNVAPDRTCILLGAHLPASLPGFRDRLDARCILYNLEQLDDTAAARLGEPYLTLLHTQPVWDYSRRNIDWLRAHGAGAELHHVTPGYAPTLSRVAPAAEQDIDVLFYGAANDRRRQVLDALRRAGLAVVHLDGVFGMERDSHIARAKIVLNLHFYATQIFEIVRVSYLMANRKPVVTEASAATEVDEGLRAGLAAVPYEALVERCVELVRDDSGQHALEERAFQIFALRDQASVLRGVLGAAWRVSPLL